MTALDQYVRLESGGLWRADPDAQRKDVTVSFGDATLVIADGAGRPLTHWSLPAVRRQNPDERPAIFSPDEDASETLEISDDIMIDAIEKVRKALMRSRPKPGKLRHITTAGGALLIAALAIFWLPSALTRQTLAVVPMSKRTEIGATVLGHIQRETGPACREARGAAAAKRLKTRLLGKDAPGQIVVVPRLLQGAVALPGGIILLDRALVEHTDDPAVPAGYIIAAATARTNQDPLESVLRRAGLGVTFTLLTTGEIPPEILQAEAKAIVEGAQAPTPIGALVTAFDAAGVPSTPYVTTQTQRNNGVAPFTADDPMTGVDAPVILNDGDWVSLQNICNDQ